MRHQLTLLFILLTSICKAQYEISGYVNTEQWQSTVYLSLIEDYRKSSGVYAEQIISKTNANNNGYFKFSGNMLDNSNRLYRIHVDKCSEQQQDINHFNGHCIDSKSLIFIANNNDVIKLPFSFENEVFCNIISTNPKTNSIIKIDSLKAEMKFAYSEYRSQANRKLNNKKWFKTLQDFGKSLNEPLAELYIYSFLSDRSSDFHNYYIKDLKNANYYSELSQRLTEKYPNSSYTIQYNKELKSDTYILDSINAGKSNNTLNYLIYSFLILSVLLNIFLIYKRKTSKKQTSKDLKRLLSKQENVVLELILQNKTNKEIAETLFVSLSTVKSHTNTIYKKLNVQSREQVKALFLGVKQKST